MSVGPTRFTSVSQGVHPLYFVILQASVLSQPLLMVYSDIHGPWRPVALSCCPSIRDQKVPFNRGYVTFISIHLAGFPRCKAVVEEAAKVSREVMVSLNFQNLSA
jgi:hypothetical protein